MVEKKQTKPQDKKKKPVAQSISKISAPNTHQKKTTTHNNNTKNIQKPSWEINFRGWLLVIFTGVLAFYTAKFFYETKESIRISKDSIVLTQKSIALSSKIANTQEKFAKIETRAYLSIEEINKFILNTHRDIEFVYSLKNSGRTPANKIKGRLYIKIGGTGSFRASEAERIDQEVVNATEMGSMSPNSIKKISQIIKDQKISRADSITVFRGIKPLFIYNILIYTDMFGDIDTTRFCYRFKPPDKFEHIDEFNIIK